MTVSIIIAVKTWAGHLEECVNKCLELDYTDFEILILPDSPIDEKVVGRLSSERVPIKIIPTGSVSPGKRETWR